ncbi:hypothetical protein [Paenibacillus sp. MBLB4367]|uniref:hypothetical protein n=1 Tax=Paenibacillus sp. MBLB4367 TaxID=3384767 RepID=UPI003907F28B
MRLNELLVQLPDSVTAVYDEHPAVANRRKQGMPVGQALASYETLADLLASMRRWEQAALRRIVLAFGSRPFEASALERAVKQDALSGAELRLGLLQLRRKGVLFSLRKSWGEQLFVLPEDTFGIWQKLLLQEEPSASGLAEPDESDGSEAFMRIAWDLLLLLRFCSEHEVKLTGKGTMAKLQLASLLKIVTLKDTDLRRFALSYEYEAFYPPQAALVLETGFRLGLIAVNENRLSVDRNALGRLLSCTNEVVHTAIYRCFRELYRPEELWLEHALVWLEGLGPDSLPKVSGLHGWLIKNGIVRETDRSDSRAVLDDWLKAMDAIGWLELLAAPDGETAIRFRVPSGGIGFRSGPSLIEPKSRHSCIYVQPDFELLVPAGVPYADIWRLSAFADIVRVDRFSAMRLTKERVSAALARGEVNGAEECLRELTSLAIYGVPDNVEGTMRQWCKQVADGLEEKLLFPKMKNARPLVLSASAENFILEIGTAHCGEFLFHPPSPAFEVDSSIPDPNEGLPDIRQVPAMWLKQFRPYHASTCKELLRQAAEWKTYVKFGIAGTERFIVPTAIVEERGEWKLQGREAENTVMLSPDQWHAVQIMLPGANPS